MHRPQSDAKRQDIEHLGKYLMSGEENNTRSLNHDLLIHNLVNDLSRRNRVCREKSGTRIP